MRVLVRTALARRRALVGFVPRSMRWPGNLSDSESDESAQSRTAVKAAGPQLMGEAGGSLPVAWPGRAR
jgi:hypothetical protein